MGSAVAVRRWLAGGAEGARAGYTASAILDEDKHAVAAIGTASAAFRPQMPSPPAATGSEFQGGRSGGGGGGGSF
jgi:hypothetical protein